SGSIQNSGTLNVTGGSLTLTGSNTFTGAIRNTSILNIAGGFVTAPITQNFGRLGISNGATAGAVTINQGSFTPGLAGNGLANSGTLTMSDLATYEQIINGTAPGAFGSLNVTGTVALDRTRLEGSGTEAGVNLGDAFLIINNDGTDPVSGTFDSLPEGATVFGQGNFDYRISYVGGSGNDVVLTAVAVSTTTTVTSSPNPAPIGHTVTFTATVTPVAGNTTPTGTVTFRDGGVVLGTVPLSGGTATFSTSTLTAGPHQITAFFSGDASHAASFSHTIIQRMTVPEAPTLSTFALAALALLLGMTAMLTLRR
ncbi:MAG TPA: Ig-like domain-containing protein, partial [Vicinamibacterales bacterium]|nr:Ig-like domain-containing protein [Vicinamibacterales bacterium]